MAYEILFAESGALDSTRASLQARYPTLATTLGTAVPNGSTSDPAIVRSVGGTALVRGSSISGSPLPPANAWKTGLTLSALMAGKRTLSWGFAGRGDNLATSTQVTFMAWGLTTAAAVNSAAVILGLGANMAGPGGFTFMTVQPTAQFPPSLIPSVAANTWRQFEVLFIAETVGGLIGEVRFYVDSTLIVSIPTDYTALASTPLVLTAGTRNPVSSSAIVDLPFAYYSDYYLASGDAPEERMGYTYITALSPTADSVTTNWASSDAAAVLATDVAKTDGLTDAPFISTESIGARAEFTSATTLPADDRIVRAVNVGGAGSSPSSASSLRQSLNGVSAGTSINYPLGAQTPLVTATGAEWIETDPADSTAWTVAKINALTFGVEREA